MKTIFSKLFRGRKLIGPSAIEDYLHLVPGGINGELEAFERTFHNLDQYQPMGL